MNPLQTYVHLIHTQNSFLPQSVQSLLSLYKSSFNAVQGNICCCVDQTEQLRTLCEPNAVSEC